MSTAAPATLWEGRTAEEWEHTLRLPLVRLYDSIGSTNDEARTLADAGAPAGTLVLSEHQAQGRGRQGRQWQAAPGSSLTFSVVLRPAPSAEAAPGTLPLRVGLAVAMAARDSGAADARVKWPNDVVLPHRGKLAGVLCEGVGAGAPHGFVIAGIGLNVRQQPEDWPAELRDVATSMDAGGGQVTDRAALLGALVERLRPLLDQAAEPLSASELAAFRSMDALSGRDVVATTAGCSVTGIAEGLDPDGALLLRTGDGVIRITSGTIRPAPSLERTRP